jgi:hypothetical protein
MIFPGQLVTRLIACLAKKIPAAIPADNDGRHHRTPLAHQRRLRLLPLLFGIIVRQDIVNFLVATVKHYLQIVVSGK